MELILLYLVSQIASESFMISRETFDSGHQLSLIDKIS
jgi:hypothetical protein